MNASGQATDTTSTGLNLSAAEIVSYVGMTLTALGLGALGGKVLGEAFSEARGMRSNPTVHAHHRIGYHVPAHHGVKGYRQPPAHIPTYRY